MGNYGKRKHCWRVGLKRKERRKKPAMTKIENPETTVFWTVPYENPANPLPEPEGPLQW